MPPPPAAEEGVPDVVPDFLPQDPPEPEDDDLPELADESDCDDEGNRIATATCSPCKLDLPHACMTFSDVATWGTDSTLSDTDAPSSQDETLEGSITTEEEDIWDDDWAVGGFSPGSGDQFDLEESDRETEEKEKEISEEARILQSPTNDQEHADADIEEAPLPRRSRRRRRKKRFQVSQVCQATVQPQQPHVDCQTRETIQRLEAEEAGKRIAKPKEIRESTGNIQQRWKLAAEAELSKNFVSMGAMHESTAEELAQHGYPLPMLCVWSQDGDKYKCRACVCGNFADIDPTQQSWTAQAEPSSLLSSIKQGRVKRWRVSKHDVKGAFMYAHIPKGKVVIVRPPEIWVKWGLVPPNTFWTLDKAVYGLRESPYLWSEERDTQLQDLRWTVKGVKYHLERCSADSQVWRLQRIAIERVEVLGTLCVYVDDFLLQTADGPERTEFLKALASIWTLAKEETLEVDHPITFLGIEMEMRTNGDVYLHQTNFAHSILKKHGMDRSKAIKCIAVGHLPEVPSPPDAKALKDLQGFSGEFNWLATRTRHDLAYYTSVLASACTKHSEWCFEFVNKIFRFLVGTANQGILISVRGCLESLVSWSDAGFAGTDTKSQTLGRFDNHMAFFQADSVYTLHCRGRAERSYFRMANHRGSPAPDRQSGCDP